MKQILFSLKKKESIRVKSFLGAVPFALEKSYSRKLVILLAAEKNYLSIKTESQEPQIFKQERMNLVEHSGVERPLEPWEIACIA